MNRDGQVEACEQGNDEPFKPTPRLGGRSLRVNRKVPRHIRMDLLRGAIIHAADGSDGFADQLIEAVRRAIRESA